MATTAGKVLSVNVGTVRAFEYNGRPAKSAIWKSPVVGRIAARGVNLAGDDQADRRAHGGPDKAVDLVITNSVPIDTVSLGQPGVQSSEIRRILASGGQWVHDGKVRFTKP